MVSTAFSNSFERYAHKLGELQLDLSRTQQILSNLIHIHLWPDSNKSRFKSSVLFELADKYGVDTKDLNEEDITDHIWLANEVLDRMHAVMIDVNSKNIILPR